MSYKGPLEIAREIVQIGKKKAESPISSTIVLSILAGVYIAIAGQVMITVTHDGAANFGAGMMRLLSGGLFSLGLILVILAGAELFTGNNLMIVGMLDKKFSFRSMFKNWSIVYLGNLIGALFIAFLVFFSGIWQFNDNAVGIFAIKMAATKTDMSFLTAVIRGIGANWLVCVAVWLSISGGTTMDKILGIFFPVMAFVILGFEHSIANMFFLPVGLLLKQVMSVAGTGGLTLSSVIFKNILPVTLGNIIGGVFFVAFPYWFVYIRNHKKHQLEAVRDAA